MQLSLYTINSSRAISTLGVSRFSALGFRGVGFREDLGVSGGASLRILSGSQMPVALNPKPETLNLVQGLDDGLRGI